MLNYIIYKTPIRQMNLWQEMLIPASAMVHVFVRSGWECALILGTATIYFKNHNYLKDVLKDHLVPEKNLDLENNP